MEMFVKSIVQMGIFMICAQVLIHFRPNGSYEKYMKILVSIMILIQVMTPFVSLITGGKSNLMENADRFREQMEAGMEEARQAAEQSDRLLSQMTMEQLKEQISMAQTEAQMKVQQDGTGQEDTAAEKTETDKMETDKTSAQGTEQKKITTEVEKITIKIGGE